MAEQSNVILVAIDFEKASMRALSFAKELGTKLGAEIVLAHVYQVPMFTYPGLEPALLPTFTAEIGDAVKKAMSELKEQVGVSRAVLKEGEPASELLAIADELSASMIVMGTHGRKGISHLLLGSVAERVVRQSKVPVLTIRCSD